jgi:hypothetical protein
MQASRPFCCKLLLIINELSVVLKFGNPHEFLTFFFDKKNPAEKFYDSVFSSETLKEQSFY